MPTIEQLDGMLQSEPDDPFLNFGMAMALAKEGHVDTALARFDRTLELDAKYVAAYFHKARVLGGDGRAEEAGKTLEEGIEVAREIGDEHARGEMTEFLATLDL